MARTSWGSTDSIVAQRPRRAPAFEAVRLQRSPRCARSCGRGRAGSGDLATSWLPLPGLNVAIPVPSCPIELEAAAE